MCPITVVSVELWSRFVEKVGPKVSGVPYSLASSFDSCGGDRRRDSDRSRIRDRASGVAVLRGKLICDVVLRRPTYVIVFVATVVVAVTAIAVTVIVDVGATDVQV